MSKDKGVQREKEMEKNDENEIIRLSCSTGGTELCSKAQKEGTFKELFGDIPNLRLLPRLACSECGSDIVIELTGKYKEQDG